MEMSGHRLAADTVLAAQRELRERLLEAGQVHRDDRGIAAEMLLHLDDPATCWAACAGWLMAQTGADRVDGGFASATDRVYTPRIERRREGEDLPSVLGAVFDARAEAIRVVWRSQHAVVYQDVLEDGRVGGSVRSGLLAAGTRSKIAVAVRDRGRDIGLLCLDSRRPYAWAPHHCERIDRVAREVIGPVLGVVRDLADAAGRPLAPGRSPSPGCALTSAELRVAQLVLAGYSYKEIAHRLNRSCSTIDHQLRSMRQKLGVNSTAKLMRELARFADVRVGMPEAA